MTPLFRKLLLVFGVLGLAASGMSSYVHYKLLTDPAYTTYCDVDAAVNCSQAYLSPYGSLLGVPIALGGVLYFAVVLLLAGMAARPASTARDSAAGYIFALSMAGLAVVVYLAWASYRLQTICLFCATTYVAVLAIFGVSGAATKFSLAALPRRAGRDLRALVTSSAALAIVLLLGVGMASTIALFPGEHAAPPPEATYAPLTDQQRAELGKWWAVQPRLDLPIPTDGAKILVVKFSDYMCPACRNTFEGYKAVLNKYVSTGQVRYVVKHYPLEAECNPSAPNNHYASCEAAAAVVMARDKGTAPALEQWIFTNQTSLTPDVVKKAARDVGGIQDFDAQYPRALEEVKADASLGGVLHVDATPTFYINGRKLPGQNITPPPYFDYLIELALKDTK